MSDNTITLIGIAALIALVAAYKRKQKTRTPVPQNRYAESGGDLAYDDSSINEMCDAADPDTMACDDSDD